MLLSTNTIKFNTINIAANNIRKYKITGFIVHSTIAKIHKLGGAAFISEV